MLDDDFFYVLKKTYGDKLSNKIISNMILINRKILQLTIRDGGPFEFNLRDLLRWSYASLKVFFKT